MEISIGNFYSNKTWRYLIPSLRGLGETFILKFNPVIKLAVGIHDSLLDNSQLSDKRSVYILCDTESSPAKFKEFYEYVKNQDYYVTSYCPDSEILKSRKRMIVIEVPERFHEAYDHFLQGNYSQMYLKDEINLLFSSPIRWKDRQVLERTLEAKTDFTKAVKDEYETEVSSADLNLAEFDFPLKIQEEVFHYEDKYETVYFSPNTKKKWEL